MTNYRNYGKVAKTPRRPYEKERLDRELKLVGEYGQTAQPLTSNTRRRMRQSVVSSQTVQATSLRGPVVVAPACVECADERTV